MPSQTIGWSVSTVEVKAWSVLGERWRRLKVV